MPSPAEPLESIEERLDAIIERPGRHRPEDLANAWQLMPAVRDQHLRERFAKAARLVVQRTPERTFDALADSHSFLSLREPVDLETAKDRGLARHVHWVTRGEQTTPYVPPHWGDHLDPLPRGARLEPFGSAELSDVIIPGCSDYVHLDGATCLNPFLTHPEGAKMAAPGTGVIGAGGGKVCVVDDLLEPDRTIDAALQMAGTQAHGFGHFHYDYLPRYMAYDARSDIPPDLPMLVNDNMPASHYQALDLVAPGRPQIRVSTNEVVHVKRLFYANHASFIPILTKPKAEFDLSYGSVSPAAIRDLRARVLRAVEAHPHGDTPERIYVVRANQTRRAIENIGQLNERAGREGFFETTMAEFDFLRQATLVARAKSFVAPIGSAADLLIYLPPGSRCLLLSSPYLGSYPNSLGIFRNMGLDIRILFGHATSEMPRRAKMSSFEVDVGDFEEALAWVTFKSD